MSVEVQGQALEAEGASAGHPHRPRALPSIAAFWRESLKPFGMQGYLVTAAGAVLVVLVLAGILAPIIAPFDPFDAASIDLADARMPPAFLPDGRLPYVLGTDAQGRDLLSSMLYGLRLSLAVGVASVLLALAIGLAIGLVAGYRGGWFETISMRVADMQLTFPALLLAILLDGCARMLFAPDKVAAYAIPVVVGAIALSSWVQFARVARAQSRIERDKEYVQAARLLGVPGARLIGLHILPNIAGAMLVLTATQFGVAVVTEATLSFLGTGLPPTEPSLGTMIRVGNEYLFSGLWWISLLPLSLLVVLVVCVNVVGDWLLQVMNPR